MAVEARVRVVATMTLMLLLWMLMMMMWLLVVVGGGGVVGGGDGVYTSGGICSCAWRGGCERSLVPYMSRYIHLEVYLSSVPITSMEV